MVLGGDMHENWVGHVKADYSRADSEAIGVEFCGTSITSRSSGKTRVPELLAERLQRRFRVSLRRRDMFDDRFQNFFYTQTCLGTDRQRVTRIQSDRALDHLFRSLDVRARQVDLIDDRQNFQPVIDREVSVRQRKLRVEFDVKQQQSLAQDLQRYLAGQSYNFVSPPQNALAFSLYWPIVQNVGVYRPYTGYNIITAQQVNYWLDETKAPLKKPA